MHMRKLSNDKAVGPDGVPAEVFKYNTKARDILFLIIQRIWEQEALTEVFGRIKFIMIFKNKGGRQMIPPNIDVSTC